jgi:hypothetical protein
MNNRMKTDVLCVASSFANGLGSVLNLRGQNYQYNVCDNPDEVAIFNDWLMVGQDIDDSLGKAYEDLALNGQQ